MPTRLLAALRPLPGRTISRRWAAAAIVAVVIAAAPACATGGYYRSRGPAAGDYREMDRWAYANGLRDGRQAGERDARARASYRVDRDRRYRSADNGFYRRGRYPLYQYQQMYREGFEAGYSEGYERWARRGPIRPGIVAPPPGRSAPGVYGSSAARNGFEDGVNAGRDDAREGRSADPRRPKDYREGDRGYSSDDGSRDEYKREYRDAFVRGYEQGYRDAR